MEDMQWIHSGTTQQVGVEQACWSRCASRCGVGNKTILSLAHTCRQLLWLLRGFLLLMCLSLDARRPTAKDVCCRGRKTRHDMQEEKMSYPNLSPQTRTPLCGLNYSGGATQLADGQMQMNGGYRGVSCVSGWLTRKRVPRCEGDPPRPSTRQLGQQTACCFGA